jgi:hypothetical protein
MNPALKNAFYQPGKNTRTQMTPFAIAPGIG